ncbi:hypothetical protein [Nevskia ramosa]|uniref:hypothetical protein n=1 Tax=Nevskia ramosa TaxID=64002 RepID=UPI003D0B4C7B
MSGLPVLYRRLFAAPTFLMAFLLALLLMAPAARATVFDDAWDCASSVGKGFYLQATVGAKALAFVASPTGAQCVANFTSTPHVVGMGVVIGVANAGVLPTHQPACEGAIYDTVAAPIANGLSLIPILPAPAKQQLFLVAKGELQGSAMRNLPGVSFVTGALSCGCGLTDAGLSVDTVKQVVSSIDNIGNACGGPVWDAAKNIVKGALGVLKNPGDAVIDGISNLGDYLSGQHKHMPPDVYFAINYGYEVSNVAGYLSTFRDWVRKNDGFYSPNPQPGMWANIEGSREGCRAYFDSHTMSPDKARRACDDMIDGTTTSDTMFANNGFKQRVRQRLFEYAVVEAVRSRAEAAAAWNEQNLTLNLPADVPATLAKAPLKRASYVLYGTDTGGMTPSIYSLDHREGAQFPFDSIGDRATKLWPQVAGDTLAPMDPFQAGAQARAQAAKAVQMAEAAYPDITGTARAQAQARVAADIAAYRKQQAQLAAINASIHESLHPELKCGPKNKEQCVAAVQQAMADCEYRKDAYSEKYPHVLDADYHNPSVLQAYRDIQQDCDQQVDVLLKASRNIVAYRSPSEDARGYSFKGANGVGNAAMLTRLERQNNANIHGGTSRNPYRVLLTQPIDGGSVSTQIPRNLPQTLPPPVATPGATPESEGRRPPPIRIPGRRDAEVPAPAPMPMPVPAPAPMPVPVPAPAPQGFTQRLPQNLPPPIAAQPPRTCAPTPQRGIVQCPDRPSFVACQQAQAEGRVRQCLAP